MIHVLVTIAVSHRERPQVLSLLEELSLASQREAGCQLYQYYLHPTDPTLLIIVEQWKDNAALKEHEQTSHFKTLLPQIKNLISSINIQRH